MMRQWGYKPQPKHKKQCPISALFRAIKNGSDIKETSDLRPLVKSVLDQGPLGSCVSHGILQQILMMAMKLGLTDSEIGSVLFAYRNARLIQDPDSVDDDTGAYPSAVLEGILKYGLPPQRYWEYDIHNFSSLPSNLAYKHAFDNAGPYQWYWIQGSLDERKEAVQLALSNGYPVGVGGEIDNAYVVWEHGDSPWNYGGKLSGRHYRVFVGHTPDYLLELNSWGSDFGDGGYIHVSYDYLREADSLLVIEKAPII